MTSSINPERADAVARLDGITYWLSTTYIPAGLNELFYQATQLRESLCLIQSANDRLNEVWEIYNQKGGLNVTNVSLIDTAGLDITINNPDDAIYVGVDPENLDEGDEDDFNPNVILLSHSTQDDFDRLQQLGDELRAIQQELLEIDPNSAFAKQLKFVTDGIAMIPDRKGMVYWQNNFVPDEDIGLDKLSSDDDAQSMAFGNQIRDATSAAQASNERARQELRSALFTWEEFVKSAGSILEGLNRMIESFARGVKGQ